MRHDFHFEFEFETFMKASAGPDKERRIAGIVSTDHMDKQLETLIQEGLDFRPFLKSGWFNDNHDKSTGKGVGYPELAELRTLPDGRKAWYVEGYLLKGHPPADEIWSMAQALERSGSGRRLGFSVEGSILERDPENPKLVRKAIVREVAITRCPVNDHTSLTCLAKSLSAGHGGSGADSGVPGAMAPITVESLEAQVPGDDSEEEKKRKKELAAKNRAAKELTKSETIAFLKTRNPQVTDKLAELVADYAIRWHAA